MCLYHVNSISKAAELWKKHISLAERQTDQDERRTFLNGGNDHMKKVEKLNLDSIYLSATARITSGDSGSAYITFFLKNARRLFLVHCREHETFWAQCLYAGRDLFNLILMRNSPRHSRSFWPVYNPHLYTIKPLEANYRL